MTCTQLKDWLKSRIDVGGGISLGSIDGNKERCIGVYLKNGSGPARVCIGGPEMTLTETLQADLLIHWGRAEPEAEAKAREVWGLFYGGTKSVNGIVSVSAESSGRTASVGISDASFAVTFGESGPPAASAVHPVNVTAHTATVTVSAAQSAAVFIFRFSAIRVMRAFIRFLSEVMVVAASNAPPRALCSGISRSSVWP